MDKPFYEFKVFDESLKFEFESIGKQGMVNKIIRYTETNIPRLYNLSLVDSLDDGTESDTIVSNNQDMEKVLATVVNTFNVFLRAHPHAQIFFTGSTPARTRLYQIAIARELSQAMNLFEIKGLTDAGFEEFVPNKTYQAFVFSLK